MTHLVIGHKGQVGRALFELLDERNRVVRGLDEKDSGTLNPERFDTLHICFPWGAAFSRQVQDYSRDWGTDGALLLVHSTVPLRAADQLPHAVFSPVRGRHPQLLEGLKTFVKYFGGPRAKEAAQLFRALGLKTAVTPTAKDAIALKLWDTTYLGWNVIFEKVIYQWCQEHGVDVQTVYHDANTTYNAGYATLGLTHFTRPVLEHQPGPIGGHCVIPNCDLLDSPLPRLILRLNAQLQSTD